MKTLLKETRRYPSSCMSVNCGMINCPKNCEYLAQLNDFKVWQKTTEAIVLDSLSPSFYTAQKVGVTGVTK